MHPLSETRNFCASEWENLFSRNERSRKCQVYVVNAEIAQLVEHNLAPKKKGFQPWQGNIKQALLNENAEIAQLVEHNLAKVGVASSSLVFRSKTKEVSRNADLTFEKISPDGVHHMSVVLVHKAAFLF